MQFLSEVVGAFVLQAWHFTLRRDGDPSKPVQWCQCQQSLGIYHITLAEFGLGLIASKSHIVYTCVTCHPSPALQSFLFVSPPGPVPPVLVWWWYPGPGPAPLSLWPRLGTCCCYSHFFTCWVCFSPECSHHHYQRVSAGSQSANSGPSDYQG